MISLNETWALSSYQWLKEWKGFKFHVLNEMGGLESVGYEIR